MLRLIVKLNFYIYEDIRFESNGKRLRILELE